MRPSRELDMAIAQQVLGYKLRTSKKYTTEETPLGDRPLRNYSGDINHAWEVVEKLGMTLIPVEGGKWFALVGLKERWNSPADFLAYLAKGEFMAAGAAVEETAPFTICMAALNAVQHRQNLVHNEQATLQ